MIIEYFATSILFSFFLFFFFGIKNELHPFQHSCSVRLYFQLFVGRPMWRMSLCYLCLFAHSGVQHFVLLYIATFSVPCCDLRYDFHIKRCSVRIYPQLCVTWLTSYLFIWHDLQKVMSKPY